MRIVGGNLRGLKLDPPQDKAIRPTTDRVREALFNILAHDPDWRGDAGPCPAGLNVLDVFAGTGALGLEALSRGAAYVSFIENARPSLDVLRANIKRARAMSQTAVLTLDAARPARARRRFDLVLMDPPYGQDLAATTLMALSKGGWLSGNARIIIESDTKDDFETPDGFQAHQCRRYGRTSLTFLQV